jgi:ketosteroid isomerase-like protein
MMTRAAAALAVLLPLSVAGAWGAAAGEEPSTAPSVAALEDEVRAAERAFAKTMADRDHAAFQSFVSEEAVFFGREAQRGRAAVAAAWKPYFDGPQAPFSWEPEHVAVVASGGLGLSSGPVYDPAGKRVGTFNSTWRKEADGRWRVVFDKGCPPCDCR